MHLHGTPSPDARLRAGRACCSRLLIPSTTTSVNTHTHTLSAHTHTHTHTHTHSQASLGSIPQPPHQARADSYYSVRSDAHFSSHLFPYLPAGSVCNNLLTWDVASLPRWPGRSPRAFNWTAAIFPPAQNSIQQLFIFIYFTSGKAGLTLCLPPGPIQIVWIMSQCLDDTEEQWLVSINQPQFALTAVITLQRASEAYWNHTFKLITFCRLVAHQSFECIKSKDHFF